MADGITDPYVNLYLDHADIRREASEHTADVRRELANSESAVLRDISDRSATMRREAAEHTTDIRHDVATEAHRVNSDVKDGQWKVTTELYKATADINKQLDSDTDRLSQQNTDYFITNQNRATDTAIQLAALKAATDFGMARLQFDIQSAADKTIAASALDAAKLSGAMALGHAQLERSLMQDGNETRKLINDVDRSNLERMLIERNADLHGHRHEALHWRGAHENMQFAALTNQIQAMNSQMSSTRSDMINFGLQSGVGQSTTSNQVR